MQPPRKTHEQILKKARDKNNSTICTALSEAVPTSFVSNIILSISLSHSLSQPLIYTRNPPCCGATFAREIALFSGRAAATTAERPH
jgi:hypothetical protein